MAEFLPLLTRPPDEIIALRGDQPVTVRQFLGQVAALAAALPDLPQAMNLCEDRYAFMLGFAAAIVRGHTNLLLPSRQPGPVAEACKRFADFYRLHDDGPTGSSAGNIDVSEFDVSDIANNSALTTESVPRIDGDHLAAVLYTSGTTGDSAQVIKCWRTLFDGVAINPRYAFPGWSLPAGIVATVPPWHMYGLEYSVMLPMRANVTVYSGNVMFPKDIRTALERFKAARILVSTPVHLRILATSGLTFPKVTHILSATAPLTPELARQVHEIMPATAIDVLGCTEAGCLAWRDPLNSEKWQFFKEFEVDRTGESTSVSADHLPEAVTLADRLKFDPDGRFELEGRAGDLIKIGGKRGSLTELTNRLLSIEGVDDAVIIARTQQASGSEARTAGLVVCPSRDIDAVRGELAALIDPVFSPRPLRKVSALPRNRTGKLRRRDVEKLIAELNG